MPTTRPPAHTAAALANPTPPGAAPTNPTTMAQCPVAAATFSSAVTLSATNPGLRRRSSGGYPGMASSGTTQMSAPAASAAANAASTRSTLPDKSPTTVLSCAAARRRYGIDPDYRRVRPSSLEAPEQAFGRGWSPDMRSLCGAKPAGLRAPDRGGAGYPLRPAVVHRRAGDSQGVQHH